MINQLKKKKSTGEHWISISDMMTGLMLVFLLISVSYILKTYRDKDQLIKDRDSMSQIAKKFDEVRNDLYKELEVKFKKYLDEKKIIIDKETLSISFPLPEDPEDIALSPVYFEKGKSDLLQAFKDILKEFFPKYVEILYKDKYRGTIQEIRIEGHSSSEWDNEKDPDKAYFRNMELSQDRTRNVLEYVLSLNEINEIKEKKEWTKSKLTANGLSSSRLKFKDDGITEDQKKSRRVEFRVVTNAEKEIEKILMKNRDIEKDEDQKKSNK